MEAIRVRQVVVEDGRVVISGLPHKKGETVEVIVFSSSSRAPRSHLTVKQIRESGLIGLWKDRDDIGDSTFYARRLREEAQNRGEISCDTAG